MASIAFSQRSSYFQPQSPSTTVTLDRASFDILIRRANLNHNAGLIKSCLPVGQDVESVFITKTEHAGLLSATERYNCLQRHLLQGGVPQETITLLSENAQPASHPTPSQARNELGSHPEDSVNGTRPVPRVPNVQRPRAHDELRTLTSDAGSDPGRSHGLDELAVQDANNDYGNDEDYFIDDEDDASPATEAPFKNGQQFARSCQRSLILTGLPDFTTLRDVTAAIRGGALLDTYYRKADRCAFVSFLREEDAIEFFKHAKRYGLYVRNKAVSVRWAESQFYLTGHAAYQIGRGASRNIVIRRCDPSHTEASIRDDLEHIHNLVAIKIEFVGGSCYIKTNSVNNAMFARTCMSSRAKYKGSKIDWDVDECAQPLQVPYQTQSHPRQTTSAEKKPASKIQNRFATLRLDDEDDDADSSEEPDLSDSEDTSTNLSDVTASK